MAKPIETLSPTDEAIFRTATLKALQGTEADPNRIGAEYLPEVITPDWITLPDQTGIEIPANSLGQKGGILHFGDAPITNGAKRFYNAVGGYTPKLLASFPIEAQYNVAGQYFWMDLEVSVNNTNASPDPLSTALQIDMVGGHSDDGSTGFFIDTGGAQFVNVRYSSLIQLVDQDGPVLTATPYHYGALTIIHQATEGVPSTRPISIRIPDSMIGDSGLGAGFAFNVDEIIQIRLLNLAETFVTKVSGKCEITPITIA